MLYVLSMCEVHLHSLSFSCLLFPLRAGDDVTRWHKAAGKVLPAARGPVCQRHTLAMRVHYFSHLFAHAFPFSLYYQYIGYEISLYFKFHLLIMYIIEVMIFLSSRSWHNTILTKSEVNGLCLPDFTYSPV